MTIAFLAAAEAELDEAVAFYEAQKQGLGATFAEDVRDGLLRVAEYPNAWQPLSARTRRYRLSRFPYGIVYTLLEGRLIVVAIMHLHRRPGYWRDRIEEG